MLSYFTPLPLAGSQLASLPDRGSPVSIIPASGMVDDPKKGGNKMMKYSKPEIVVLGDAKTAIEVIGKPSSGNDLGPQTNQPAYDLDD
jgi:hypothetical protein